MRLEQKGVQEFEASEKWKVILQSEDFSLLVLEWIKEPQKNRAMHVDDIAKRFDVLSSAVTVWIQELLDSARPIGMLESDWRTIVDFFSKSRQREMIAAANIGCNPYHSRMKIDRLVIYSSIYISLLDCVHFSSSGSSRSLSVPMFSSSATAPTSFLGGIQDTNAVSVA